MPTGGKPGHSRLNAILSIEGSTMAASERPIIETRHDQMFPVLEPAEIDRVRRFGETRSYRAGERLATTGEVGPGMFVILAGEVIITSATNLL
jgi:thioredoxin reductase (NADPH)